jgi:hypothetical protein
MKITLIKVREKKNAMHPNLISVGFEKIGELVNEPEVGENFWVGDNWRTSTVTKVINKNMFETLNSVYRIRRQVKKLAPGGEIKDLRELVKLAEEKQSVFFHLGGKILCNRPAAFLIQWSLAKLINHTFYYCIDENDITEVEFEEDDFKETSMLAEHLNAMRTPGDIIITAVTQKLNH